MNPFCDACVGSCCSFKTLNIGYSDIKGSVAKSLNDDLLRPSGEPLRMEWYTAKLGDKRWLVFDCLHLKDGKCSIYADRPKMCRQFKCDVLEGKMKLGPFLREFGPKPDEKRYNVTRIVNAALRKMRREAKD